MLRRKLILVLGLMLAVVASPAANAGTMVLDSFVDQSPATINLPATKLLMATVNTTAAQGGNDASVTTVSIGGTVVAADIAEVCVDYIGAEVACQASPGSLSNISLSLGGNEKGGQPFDYRVTLNSSAAGKTIQLTVESISNTNLTDNIPLPASTLTRSIGGATVAPTVTTPTFTGVTDTTATLGGSVTADGGATVTDRGIVWNTSSPAETGGTTVSMGSGTGTFAQLVSSLPQGTLIYFKAYATNSVDTSYSTESSFTTLALAPTVTTPTFTAVTDTTATLGGNVTADGGATVTSRGVEWGTDLGGPYPNSVSAAAGGAGIFTVSVTGLPESSTIYFRAWATNATGTSVSAENSFTTNATPVAPTVTTPTFTGVTDTTATLGGNVTADGGATVSERGVVWNTTSPAETGGTIIPMGSGTGTFAQLVSSLPQDTLIYFKAYATNTAGTSYSTESSFQTDAGAIPPTVTTPTFTGVTDTTATLGGNVTADGGATVTDRGVVWNTTSPAETGGTITSMGSGTGTFAQLVSSLPPGTLIYFKAYATNTAGTSYSSESSFTTLVGLPTVDSPTVADITTDSATLGGTVTADGGATVSARGIVWNTTTPPETGGTIVPMGSGLGTFSNTVGSLPAETLVYFRAYATNSQGTAYSTISSFTTGAGSEPTVQVSNLLFPTVAGRSIRMTWTRGNGDGVIVVMRLTATGITAPQDGNDYTGDPDFSAPPPELPTSSQNFVVYKGAGTSVLVTGLTMTTGYSVAVYEYKGAGASTDYLLTTPAERSQATTDYAVHNYDNRVDCDDCHNHGAFGARDTELKAVCVTCHNPSGLASNKLEFDNHVTPTKNPGIDFVDCGMCHEMHNLNATDTTLSLNDVTSVTKHNKSFLRANVNKYVSTASPPAYLHTDTPLRVDPHPDAPQAADNPDRAVEGGNDTTATGYCQVCHSLTDYHRSSDTVGAEQCHDGGSNTSCGPAEVDCGSCHEHNNNFAGAGGSCVECHNSVRGARPVITTQFDRLSTHISGGSAAVTQEDCLVCHDQSTHTTQTVRMVDADNAGTIYSQLTAGASTLADEEGEQFAPACLSCHDSNGASRLPGTGDQTPSSPFTGSGAPPVIDPTGWISASHNRPVATSGSSPLTCVGDGVNGCHGSGHGSEQNSLWAPAAGAAISATDFCYVCHDSDGPSGIDITAQFDTGTNFQTAANGGALVNQRHDITAADQAYSGGAVTCKDCHRPHEDATEEIVGSVVVNNPVGNPDTGAALALYSIENSYTGDATSFTYYDGTDAFPDLDPTNPDGGTSIPEPDYIEFCLVCHDGATPAGVTMPGAMLNMADAYRLDDQHGRLEGRSSSSRGYLKEPWASAADYAAGSQPGGGNSTYAALNCTLCHGAHGSGNVFNLRTSITVNGQAMTVGGLEVFPNPADCTSKCDDINNSLPEFGSTTYFLPVQENLSWGAWCTFCHEPSHGAADGTGCQSGHLHGGGNF